jgi:hypothetical protein
VSRLRPDTGEREDPEIYLAASAGSVLALQAAPTTPPEGVGRASRRALCDALLRRDRPITISGNLVLLASVISVLSATLLW